MSFAQLRRTGMRIASHACLLPEFKRILHHNSQTPLPPHAQQLSTPRRGYVASAKETKDHQITVGVGFSPGLPDRSDSSLSPNRTQLFVSQRSQSQRSAPIKQNSLSTELAAKEKELKASLSARIAEVLKDKRHCLLEALIAEAGHEDLGLVDDIKKGFDLTGALPRSGVFTQKFGPASMTCDDLRKVSDLSRSVLLESVQSSGDGEPDVSFFAAT